MTLNVLAVTYDNFLSHPTTENSYSTAQEGQLRLAKLLDKYVIITQRDAQSVPSSIKLAPNLQIYPTRSMRKNLYVRGAYLLGKELVTLNAINCIATTHSQKTGLVGYLLKRKFGIPLNINMAADVVDNEHFINERPRHKLHNAMTKWLLKQADSIRVSTEQEKEKLSAYPDLPEIWHIPYLIDPSHYQSPATKGWRARVMGEEFDHVVLYTSYLVERNDPLTLIDAAKIVAEASPRTRFVLVGNGPMLETVQNKIELLGLQSNVMLFGYVPKDQLPAIHNSADIFVTTAKYDGSSLPLQEAAVSGKPMVATAFAGAHEIISNGDNGFIAPIGDSGQLAQHILHLINNDNQRSMMAQVAKQRARRLLSNDDATELYRQMWQATVDKK